MIVWDSIKHLTKVQIDKITYRNAMRAFQFDPFKHIPKEQLTVGALRAEANAQGVDTSYKSSGGAALLALGAEPRAVTLGILKMFDIHSQRAT